MCGIAGFYQTSFHYTLLPHWHTRLKQMQRSLCHRGSAEEDIVLLPHAGLAHVRQKTLPSQQNLQPLRKKTANQKNCTIVYNGTLYNPKELRQQLTASELRWETNDDAELILNGYLSNGTAFFNNSTARSLLPSMMRTLTNYYSVGTR